MLIMRSVQYLTMDINKRTQQTITANVGEVGSRFVKIKLMDNDKPMDLTGVNAYIYALKSDNTKIFNTVEIEDAKNGTILAEITSQLLVTVGSIKLTLVLLEGSNKLGSKEFTLNVDDSMLNDEVVESTNEFTALTRALGSVQNIDNRFANVDEQFISKANKDDVARISSGTPLFASSISEMSDTTRNYVNTTDGYLYTYNDGSWINSNIKYQEMGLSDGQVTPVKTSFLELDLNNNLFDGEYTSGISIQLSSGSYKVLSADNNRKIAIIEIKSNTTYAIRIEPKSSMCRIVTSTSIKNIGELLDGTVKIDNGTSPVATFTTGENDNYVYIMTTYTGETPYLQVLEGTDTTLKGTDYLYKLKNISAYSKYEIDSLLNKYDLKRKILFKKNSDIIDIYVPSKKTTNYLHYKFKKINDTSINFNQWRVYNTNIVNSDLTTIIPFQENIEWEGAIKENGADDFVGGYHGDETNIDINIIVDNVDLDINSDYDLQCDNIKIVTKSTLNRCNTPSINLFTRYRVNEWNCDNYIISNKITALENVNIQYCYLAMLSIPRVVNGKNVVGYARYDDDYKKTDVSATTPGGCFNPSQTARVFEMWGDGTLYAKVESIADYEKRPHLTIGDRSQSNIMKAYFDLARGYEITKGETINCKSIYTIVI